MTVTTINTDDSIMTLVNVFTVSPEHQQELVDVLVEAIVCDAVHVRHV